MSAKTYIEPQTTLTVYDECDLLVVGGGAAGHSAAVAAARAGCRNIILMERYGYCGGDNPSARAISQCPDRGAGACGKACLPADKVA